MANAEKDTYDVPVDDEEFFDVLDDEEEGGRGPILIVVAILVLVAFSGVIYVAYNQGVREGMRNAPEMLRADSGPFRAQPEDRGGVTVEHTEKEVLKNIAPGQTADANNSAETEQLLPPPETPMKLPSEQEGSSAGAPAIGTNTDVVDLPAEGETEALLPPPVENTESAPVEIAEVVETPETPVVSSETEQAVATETNNNTNDGAETATPSVATEEVTTEAVVPAEVVETPPAEAPAATVQAFNDPYVVQLASFRTSEDALRAWQSFKGRFESIVGAYGPDVKAAEVPNRGTYHRLRVGPMEGRPAAEAVCGQLKSRGQDCLVTAQ